MKFTLASLAIGTSLLSTVLAADYLKIRDGLVKRDGAFLVERDTVAVCEVKDRCGDHWCLRPNFGDICCSEGYACPPGSYCLTKGHCCPRDLDAKACARAYGLTALSDFNTKTTEAGQGSATVSGTRTSLSGTALPGSQPATATMSGSSTVTSTASLSGASSSSHASSTPAVATGGAAPVVYQAAGGLAAAIAAAGYLI